MKIKSNTGSPCSHDWVPSDHEWYAGGHNFIVAYSLCLKCGAELTELYELKATSIADQSRRLTQFRDGNSGMTPSNIKQ